MRKVLFLFGELDDDDVEWMMATGRKQRIPAGSTLIFEGKAIDAMYILLDGVMAVSSKALNNTEIARLLPGDVVGEMSFVDARPPSATVKAIENATVLTIARAELTRRLEKNQAFAARFYRALAIFLADRLRSTVSLLGYGEGRRLADDVEYADELDMNVLDGVYLAGSRFDRMLKQLMAE